MLYVVCRCLFSRLFLGVSLSEWFLRLVFMGVVLMSLLAIIVYVFPIDVELLILVAV